MVIAHRAGHTSGLPCVSRENIGLEWGAYSFFLKHHWDGKSDVLFMHDDTELRLEFLSEMSSVPHDLAFVFENEQDFQDFYTHGRVFFASARFLGIARSQEGIWYDRGNQGFTTDRARTDKTPAGCQDHNAGIRAFTSQAEEIGKRYPSFSVNRPFFSENIRYGIRGQLRNTPAEQRHAADARFARR